MSDMKFGLSTYDKVSAMLSGVGFAVVVFGVVYAISWFVITMNAIATC